MVKPLRAKALSGATSLQTRIILYLIPLLAVLICAVTVLGMGMIRRGIIEQMQLDGVALARSYALSAENAIILGSGLGRVTGESSRSSGVRYLKIVDDKGVVIAHTDVSAIGKRDVDSWVEEALTGPITAVQVGSRPISGMSRAEGDVGGDQVFRVVVPLVVLDSVVGALDLGLDTTGVFEALSQSARQALAVAAVGLVFGALYAWFFARAVTRPIGRLAHAADMIARGDLDQEVALDSGDEIGRLAFSFNRMARSLKEYTGNLRRANAEIEARAETIQKLMSYTEDILANIPAGVITVDLDGKVTVANAAARKLLAGATAGSSKAAPAAAQPGIDPGQAGREPAATSVIGTHYRQAFSATPAIVALIDDALSQGRTMRGCETTVPISGVSVTLVASTSVLSDRSQQPLGVAVTFEDVTELRALQRQVHEAAKLAAVGELSAGLAHEVRNPLGAIKACSQFLEDRVPEDESLGKFTRILVREVDRLDRLVERLLSFAKPRESDMQYVDVHEILDRMVSLVGLKAKQAKVDVVRRYQPNLPRVFADPEKLQQAFLNIMLNAIDAMPCGGVLAVATSICGDSEQVANGRVRVDFRDTGVGIPPDQLDKVFTPFFTTRERGTGLGLAIARRVVSEHGGEITVESMPGVGTAFSVFLPAAQGATVEIGQAVGGAAPDDMMT
ncbi:MAG: ATP-binding protein [Firmicutes bacterium]|nr:ATP-binding protein [Bacillota bacterium]MDH7495891.1 ATP-binding protein [Bacillota bacterium]